MNSYRESHLGEGKGRWYDDAHAKKFDAVIWRHFIKPRLAIEFERCVRAGARRYLDFACGTGRILKLGSRHVPDAMGIDISPDMQDVARRRVPGARFLCLDVTRDAVPEDLGQFDVVTLFRFLLNAETTLSVEVLAWLADRMPAGAVLIGNNHMETWSIPGIVTAAANALINRGRNHLSRGDVQRLLGETGFRVERWYGCRLLPTVMGKPIIGSGPQLAAERVLCALGAGRYGAEQLFVARRV